MTSTKKHHPQRYGGKLVYSLRDDYGLIEVVDHKERRSLHFGSVIEQSCTSLNGHSLPGFLHEHKMMLAAALHFEPQQALVLGLGAGSLARNLYHALPALQIIAVEQREAVIDVALEYFQLPADARMQLYTADAEQFLTVLETGQDLVLVDLFNARGMDETNLRLSFLDHCYQQLNDDGILAINLWRDDLDAFATACTYLETIFADKVWYLDEADGNTIAFAFRRELPELTHAIENSANHLGIDGHTMLRQLRQRNANRISAKLG